MSSVDLRRLYPHQAITVFPSFDQISSLWSRVPGTHSEAGGDLFLLWVVGLAFFALGLLFLYKAITCKGFRETDVGEGKKRISPTWMGRFVSAFLGLTSVAVGLAIIMRILNG